MNKIIKRVVSAVTALAVTLSVAVMFDVPEKISAAAEGTHSHKVCVGTAHDGCAHENIEFEPFPDLEDNTRQPILRGKNYYLTKNIVLEGDGRIFVEKGVTNICLNGHSITKANGQIIDINQIDGQPAVLNICDCVGTGKITNTSDVSGYACITVIDDSTFNLYGGCIDGGAQGGGIDVHNYGGATGAANIYGGSVQTRDNYGVWLHNHGSSLSVYGGEIQALGYHTVYVTDEHCKASVYGGKISGSSDNYSAFCVRGEGASVDINGGEVIGQSGQGTIKCLQGTVEIKGGEVKSESQTGTCIINADTLVISGGTVSSSGYYGIHNQVDYNNGTISPGITTISGGTVNSAGTAIYNGYESTVEIKGGKITSTSEQYSGIYNYGTLKISGGEIKAKGTYTLNNYEDAVLEISGGTVETENYALYNRTGGSASISGGNISGGGYCIWNDGTLDISDGEITSTSHSVVNHGTLNISGGSFGTENPEVAKYIANNKVLNLSGSPIFNNTSIWLQSNDNITISGALTSSEPYTVYVNSDLPRTITSGWDDRMTDKNASKYFKSPYNGAKIVYRDNEAVMVYYYKITYDANGGSCSVQSAETDSSDKLTSLAVPTREGYSFDGWFTEETGGEQVTTDTVFTDDTTIYAHWTCNDHIWGDTYEKDENQHWQICTRCNTESEKTTHLWDDGKITKQPTADAEGEKTFECTVCGKTKTETLPPKDEPSDPDSGNISVDVQPGENAPDTELKTPFDELADAILTPEEQENIKNGVDIKIILIVSDATESVPADDRAKVEVAIRGLSGYKLGQYLDLNLLKIIGNSDGIRITQTNKPITVTFEIPAALRGKAEYSVIRVHGGETEVLRDLDNDSDTVTIETDKFSTYALVYKEKSTPSNPDGGNISGGNPGDSPNPPTSTPDESDNSDDTPSDDDNPSRDDSSDTTSNESKPTDEDNSDATSSDDGNTTSSESDTSNNVSDHSPIESSPSKDNGNPSTGIAVSLIPLVTATAILTVAVKRKKK